MEGFRRISLTMFLQITDSPKVRFIEENTDSSIHHAASMFHPVGIKQRFSSSYRRFIVFTPVRLITKNAGTLI
jgi:hypothetical protein